MPPIPAEQLESLLSELLKEDLEVSRKTEILHEFRVANTQDHQDFEKLNKNLETLKTQKEDLVVSNSMLFRKLGIEEAKGDDKQKIEEKTFSETVTLEDLLK